MMQQHLIKRPSYVKSHYIYVFQWRIIEKKEVIHCLIFLSNGLRIFGKSLSEILGFWSIVITLFNILLRRSIILVERSCNPAITLHITTKSELQEIVKRERGTFAFTTASIRVQKMAHCISNF